MMSEAERLKNGSGVTSMRTYKLPRVRVRITVRVRVRVRVKVEV
jgi:hypothetical protein